MSTHQYQARVDLGAGYVTFPGFLGAQVSYANSGGVGPLAWGGAYLPSGSIRGGPLSSGLGGSGVRANVQVSTDAGATWADLVTCLLFSQEGDHGEYSYPITPLVRIIERASIRLPVLEWRPIAHKTTATSDEDGPEGGILNRLFTAAGGLPIEQGAGDYSDAPFYYSCQAVLSNVPYAVLDTDNAWQTALELVKAAGGQIVQDGAGVFRVSSALAYGTPGPSPLSLATARRTFSRDKQTVLGRVIAPYQKRVRMVEQDVYDDRPGIVVLPGETHTLELAMQRPVVVYRSYTVACSRAGEPVTPPITLVGESAMGYRLEVENTDADYPLLIERVVVRGDPVAVVGEGVARLGTVGDELRLEANAFVQTESAARRWAVSALRTLETLRPVLSYSDLAFDERLMPGGTIEATDTLLSLSAADCRVTSASFESTGAVASITAVPMTGLLGEGDVFRAGQSYADADERKWGY